jgi:hypothetical protein
VEIIMNRISPIPSDVAELARRRALAAARRTREAERTSLLRRLIRMERQADQLSGWIALCETDVETTPEIQRMVDWAKVKLGGLEEFLDPSNLSQLLHTRNLFPEVDDLVDPLGEPPPRRSLGR